MKCGDIIFCRYFGAGWYDLFKNVFEFLIHPNHIFQTTIAFQKMF